MIMGAIIGRGGWGLRFAVRCSMALFGEVFGVVLGVWGVGLFGYCGGLFEMCTCRLWDLFLLIPFALDISC